MENGLVSKQSYLLRQAARIFSNLKDTHKSAMCNGYAEIFDKNYFPAGESFYGGGWTDLAVQAFFLANKIKNNENGFKKITEISTSNSTLVDSLYYHVALAVCKPTSELVDKLMDFLL